MATVLSSRLGFAPLALPRSRSPPSARAAQHRPALALSDRRSSRPPLPLQRPLRGLAFRPLAAPSPRDLSLQQSATAGDALGSGPDASNSFDEDVLPGSSSSAGGGTTARDRLETAYSLPGPTTSGNGALDAALNALIAGFTMLQRSGQGATTAASSAEAEAATSTGAAYHGVYAELAGEYDAAKLKQFFAERPWEVALRLLEMARLALNVRNVWLSEEELPQEQRTRGAVLRAAVSQLGPVFVKCGQTMAQRADLIGKEAARSLKALQSSNQPFPDELAWQIILNDLGHDGPLSPDCPVHGREAGGRPLFAKFQARHIASASLGQVYRATTWEGEEVALKVQRPAVLRQVALDMYVLRLGLIVLKRVWNMTNDLLPIADEVGTGIFKELDYHLEAKNALDFNRAHQFLGYVRAPRFVPEYTGPVGTARVLALEWINGKHIGDLDQDRAKLMVAMAVEASVAQLLRTGFVHVDPHEGNMMFTDDDELCYIDFGLMARVAPQNMEAFASGVCHMLARKYDNLSDDFVQCGIVPEEDYLGIRANGETFPVPKAEFAGALKFYMEGEADGNTRFGALATGLAQMSSKYKLKTPPYIILLCRTFLTLEGIASKVEPNFSIYTAALPFAVRRALSPETPRGVDALRAALLDEEGNFRFDYITQVLEQQETLSDPNGTGNAPKMSPSTDSGRSSKKKAPAGAQPSSSAETLTGLLGSTAGEPLRRVARDANTIAIARTLAAPGGKGSLIRREGARALAVAFRSRDESMDEEIDIAVMPPAARIKLSLRAKEQIRMKRAMRHLARSHLANLLRSGPRGWLAMVGLVLVFLRVVAGAALHIVQDEVAQRWRALFGGKDAKKEEGSTATATSASAP